jgi:hypothetical protein
MFVTDDVNKELFSAFFFLIPADDIGNHIVGKQGTVRIKWII